MLIPSLLDTDLYKFTMLQVVFKKFSQTRVTYKFYCRSPATDFSPIEKGFSRAIDQFSQLRFKNTEIDYLRGLGYFDEDFLIWLKGFKPDPSAITYRFHQKRLELNIKGLWSETILFEIPLLAMISELLGEQNKEEKSGLLRQRLDAKINEFNQRSGQFPFSDFGTRRRSSHNWHKTVLTELKHKLGTHLAGTSNVYFAKELGLNPVGTMAHEYLQACQALSGNFIGSQAYALKIWLDIYGSELSIALTDVIGLNVFLKEFSPELAKAYQGVRHDSGDPFAFGEAMIRFYELNQIDPAQKVLTYSDGLDFEISRKLWEHFHQRIPVRFGIGSFLTNDTGVKPANIVIKMTHCNDLPVAKISDAPGKAICEDPEFLNAVRQYKSSENP